MLTRLTDEDRLQLYAQGRLAFNETADSPSFLRRRRTLLLLKSKLAGIGWEQILISIAIQFFVPMLIKWLESLVKDPGFEPPAAMPLRFGAVGETEFDDDDE